MLSRLSFRKLAGGLALALPLLFGGCHSSNDTVYYYSNTLHIQNDPASIGDIWYAYVSPAGSSSWGSDLLGIDVLQPGDEMVIDVYDCDRYYDIRVEYDAGLGATIEKLGVWLPCNATTTVTFIDW